MALVHDLFWGDNGVHEYWEDEQHHLLIFRNHQEDFWTAHRDYGYLFKVPSADLAATRLGVTLSQKQVWVRRKGKFVLEAKSSTADRKQKVKSRVRKDGPSRPLLQAGHLTLRNPYL